MKKSSPGFTLVELLVTISAAALVLACAVSYVLLGLRMENRSTETASQQQTVRIMLTMTEQMVAEGDISSIRTVGDSWTLYNAADKPLLRYLAEDGTLRSGSTILLSGLEDADASMDGDLFTLSLETEGRKYKTSVYCRFGEITVAEMNADQIMEHAQDRYLHDFEGTKDGRLAFLEVLCSQSGSTGQIVGHTVTEDEPWKYFSEWYIGGYDEKNPGWNSDTPWCACFLSWGAAQDTVTEYLTADAPRFANVDTGMETFKNRSRWHDQVGADDVIFQPDPGDVVFFSWDGDDNPEHAGAVLYVSGDTVYTIEGNCDDTVAVNSYLIGSEYIIGYGILDWKTIENAG